MDKYMVVTYYDLKCDYCGKWISSDYGYGMQKSKKDVLNIASDTGWVIKNSGKIAICCDCFNKNK